MMRASHVSEFIRDNRRLQMPFFNVVYADRDGQIMYLFGGRQPRRSGGTYAKWSGIIPGDTSATLWTDTLKWRGVPHTINSPRGVVQNLKNTPLVFRFSGTNLQKHYSFFFAPKQNGFLP